MISGNLISELFSSIFFLVRFQLNLHSVILLKNQEKELFCEKAMEGMSLEFLHLLIVSHCIALC